MKPTVASFLRNISKRIGVSAKLRVSLVLLLIPFLLVLAPQTASGDNGITYMAEDVLTLASGSLVHINASGLRKSIASVHRDSFGLTVDRAGNIYVVGFTQGTISRVDPRTGSVSLISSGGLLVFPHSVTTDVEGNLFVSVQGGTTGVGNSPAAIVRVDPVTGNQTLVSQGGQLNQPSGLVFDKGGNLIVACRVTSILRVNPVTGAQNFIASVNSASGVAVEPDGHIIFVDASFNIKGGLFRLDPLTGSSSLISAAGFFEDPLSVAIDPQGNFVVADSATNRVIRVKASDGMQTILADGLSFANGIVILSHAEANAMNGNQAPTANAGPDQSLEATDPLSNIVLNGTASSDPDGDSLDYKWSEQGLAIGSGAVLNTSLAIGTHVITLTVTDSQGLTSEDHVTVNLIDSQPPVLTCGSSDGTWHAEDVTIACIAVDIASGLQHAEDANFSLSTTVAVGAESNNALTTSRTVCDAAGNCATAGPISGNKVDKKAPTITLKSPSATSYQLNQILSSDYDCSDQGAGVLTCSGTAENGSVVDTTSVGRKTFTVTAVDNVGNTVTRSISYNISYGVCLLYDPTRSIRSGKPIAVKVSLCDVNGSNVSSASVLITATGVLLVSTNASETLQDAGNANPDNNFRYDPTLNGYIFNLSTNGYITGTYSLTFIATGDSVIHNAPFQVR